MEENSITTKVSLVFGNTPGFINNWSRIAWLPVYNEIQTLLKQGKLIVDKIYYYREVPGFIKSYFPNVPFEDLRNLTHKDHSDKFICFGVPAPFNVQFKTKSRIPTTDDIWPFLAKFFIDHKIETLTFAIDPAQVDFTGNIVFMDNQDYQSDNLKFEIDGRFYVIRSKNHLDSWIDIQMLLHRSNVYDYVKNISMNVNVSKLRHELYDKTYELYGVYSNLHNRKLDKFLNNLRDECYKAKDHKRFIDIIEPLKTVPVEDYELNLKESMTTIIAKPPIISESVSINRIWQALSNHCFPILADNAYRPCGLFQNLPTWSEIIGDKDFTNAIVEAWVKLAGHVYVYITRNTESSIEKLRSTLLDKTVSFDSNSTTDINESKSPELNDLFDKVKLDPSLQLICEKLFEYHKSKFDMEPKPQDLFMKLIEFSVQSNSVWQETNGDILAAKPLAAVIITALNTSMYLGISESVQSEISKYLNNKDSGK